MNPTHDAAPRAPLLRLPAGALLAIHRVLSRDRSPRESAELVRELGFESGEAFHRAFAEWLADRGEGDDPAALPADRFWPALGEFFSALGWGRLELDRPHAGVVSLSSPAWAEADAGGGARQPTCHLTTGLLADLLARVAGTDLAVMEAECRSRGDRECRFLLGSPEALDLVHGRLRDGASYPEAVAALG